MRHSVAFILLVLFPISSSVCSEPQGERLESFRRAVSDELEVLAREAEPWARAQGHVQVRAIKADPDAKKRFSTARAAFREAVVENWPYDRPPPVLEQVASQGTLNVMRVRPRPAALAFKEARAFYGHEYLRQRTASREDVVSKYLSVADRFPGEPEHDLALRAAGHLYLQGYRQGDERDIGRAKAIFERLADRPGLPSAWMILAEGNLVSFEEDPEARMKARSAFVERLEGRSRFDWLRRHLLTPWPNSAPDDFVEEVTGYLVQLHAVKHTTALNAIGDARATDDPLENLEHLRVRHANNEIIRKLIERAEKKERERLPP